MNTATATDTETDTGRAALAVWFSTPVASTDRPRDELAIKLALALTTPGVDVPAVVQTQRVATIRSLQEYTQLKKQAGETDTAWTLILDSMIFRAEAEVRWLDHCEASLVRDSVKAAVHDSPVVDSTATEHEHREASRQ